MPQQTPPPRDTDTGPSTPPGPSSPTGGNATGGSTDTNGNSTGGSTPPNPGASTGTGPGTPSAPSTGNRFFGWMRSLGIPRQHGWIGGVCAGIAARLGIDPLIVRGIVVVLAILGAPALLVYAIAWLLLPDVTNKIHLEELFAGRFESPIAGIAAMIGVALLVPFDGFPFIVIGDGQWFSPIWSTGLGRSIWAICIIASVIWFIVWLARRASRRPAPAPAGPAAGAYGAAGAAGAPFASGRADAASAAPTQPAASGWVAPQPAAYAPPPASPGSEASTEQLAAWREQQAQWKVQHDAYRQQQAGAQQAARAVAAEQARAERAARQALEFEEHARTRSHPLYSLVVIGLALVAGGLVAMAGSTAAFEVSAVVSGLAAALAVLALGIVINGIRGKRGGGSTGFAIVLLVPLLFAAIFPQGSNFRYGADVSFTPTDQPGSSAQVFVAGVGDVSLDLRDYFANTTGDGDVDASADPVRLVVGAGDVTVYVAADDFVRFESDIANGNTSIQRLDGSTDVTSGGINTMFTPGSNRVTASTDDADATVEDQNDAWASAPRALDVDVRVGAGTVTVIVTEGARS